ncbi:hypothetical protein DL93DRAFT_623036 [Clavulina sp. PMI_390]|nr:hypothetical protein DL93DRAFT_623036 [Clavulina sp. PMI_390]
MKRIERRNNHEATLSRQSQAQTHLPLVDPQDGQPQQHPRGPYPPPPSHPMHSVGMPKQGMNERYDHQQQQLSHPPTHPPPHHDHKLAPLHLPPPPQDLRRAYSDERISGASDRTMTDSHYHREDDDDGEDDDEDELANDDYPLNMSTSRDRRAQSPAPYRYVGPPLSSSRSSLPESNERTERPEHLHPYEPSSRRYHSRSPSPSRSRSPAPRAYYPGRERAGRSPSPSPPQSGPIYHMSSVRSNEDMERERAHGSASSSGNSPASSSISSPVTVLGKRRSPPADAPATRDDVRDNSDRENNDWQRSNSRRWMEGPRLEAISS